MHNPKGIPLIAFQSGWYHFNLNSLLSCAGITQLGLVMKRQIILLPPPCPMLDVLQFVCLWLGNRQCTLKQRAGQNPFP